MKSNIVDIEVVYHYQTEKAILVASDETTKPVWLIKSMVEVESGASTVRGAIIEISLPQSLAEEKELV